jgi:RNAse (barnase) inhibitor barstar
VRIYKIDCNNIIDWDSFHDVFKTTFGFPDYYGRNMNAWIDGISDETETFTLSLDNVKAFRQRCPELYDAIIECSAFVNYRCVEAGEQPLIILSFWG